MGDNLEAVKLELDCAHVRRSKPDPATTSRGANAHYPSARNWCSRSFPCRRDCNANGDIFGGWVMAQVDLAGGVIAARHAKGRIATVAVKEFIFKQPVRVGDILSFYSELTRIGRTSITVTVEVYAERFGSQGRICQGDRGHAHVCRDRRRGASRARCPRRRSPDPVRVMLDLPVSRVLKAESRSGGSR